MARRVIRSGLLFPALLLLCSSVPPAGAQEGTGVGAEYREVTEEAGLVGAPGRRVACADVNGDGFDDLLFRGALWLNGGDGTFEDVTERVGLPGPVATSGLLCDVDADGRRDVVLAARDGLRVFLLGEDGGFEEVTDRSDLEPFGASPEGLAAGDLDGDGLLDLYVAVYEEPFDEGHPDRVYRNRGEGAFEDVTEAWGATAEAQCGRGVAMADVDDDGDLDVYVSNYRLDRNFLWRNDGEGNLTDVAAELGVAGHEQEGWYGHTIGSAWGDIDGDGDLDLVGGNLAHPRFIEVSDTTYVYEQTDDGTFVDRFETSGVAYEETHSDASLADHDADGDLDLYLTSVYEGRPSFLYENDGSGRFTDVTDEAGVRCENGWGHAWLDLENDGDLDLVVCADRVRLFENRGHGNHWIRLRLPVGAVGARVEVTAGERTRVREVACGRGTSSRDSPVCFVGLGEHGDPVRVVVRWPDGERQAVGELAPDRTWRVTRDGAEAE